MPAEPTKKPLRFEYGTESCELVDFNAKTMRATIRGTDGKLRTVAFAHLPRTLKKHLNPR